ncbi:MAG: M81 family metallopeptidase, partial [Hyphomicrobiales bacterium]|nr:M81 family metallopeptidase [Hyphomicrobiales bacterium]
MRFLIAQFSHETNTFSPVPTKIDRFCREGEKPLSGEAAIAHYRGTGTCMGGFLDVAA